MISICRPEKLPNAVLLLLTSPNRKVLTVGFPIVWKKSNSLEKHLKSARRKSTVSNWKSFLALRLCWAVIRLNPSECMLNAIVGTITFIVIVRKPVLYGSWCWTQAEKGVLSYVFIVFWGTMLVLLGIEIVVWSLPHVRLKILLSRKLKEEHYYNVLTLLCGDQWSHYWPLYKLFVHLYGLSVLVMILFIHIDYLCL